MLIQTFKSIGRTEPVAWALQERFIIKIVASPGIQHEQSPKPSPESPALLATMDIEHGSNSFKVPPSSVSCSSREKSVLHENPSCFLFEPMIQRYPKSALHR